MPLKSSVSAVLTHVAAVGSKALSLLSGLLAASLMLYSSYVLYDTFYTESLAAKSGWDVLQFRPEIIDDGAVPLSGADTLAAINKDYRAWLTVYDTGIDYPVMQGKDDLYYASHDVHGKSSITGAIYMAAANTAGLTDSYNLVYGHHMDRSIMFGALDDYETQTYFDAHREGVLVTPDKVYDLQMFAVLKTHAYETSVYTVGDRADSVVSFLRSQVGSTGKSVTLLFDEAAASGAKQILAMSTCADATTSGRLVVFAVMTERVLTPAEPPVDIEDNVVINPVVPVNPVNPVNPVTPDDPGGADGPDDTEVIDDPETPLAKAIKAFEPTGSSYGAKHCWAVVNLVCVILTVYLFIPVTHLRAKFGRGKMMKRINAAKEELREAKELLAEQKAERDRIRAQAMADRLAAGENGETVLPPGAEVTADEFATAVETLYYEARRFLRKFRLGVGFEGLDAVIAVIVFLITENMRLPMVLIDRWTPLMLVLMLICWVIDVRLVRYRKKLLSDEEADIRRETEILRDAVKSE